MSTEPITAVSEDGTEYPSWDDLVEAESNGYIVTAVLKEGKTIFTWSAGPYPSKKAAQNARVRMRNRHRKDKAAGKVESEFLATTVRPLWRDI